MKVSILAAQRSDLFVISLLGALSVVSLLGFFQLGVGAVISTAISAATPEDRIPIIATFGVTAAVGLIILILGRKRAHASPVAE